jgi:DNA-binding response OmpR family regulator
MSVGDRFGRILLVDDEEEVQTLVGWVLRDLGYDVDLAGSGPEAIGCLSAARPDLVLLDLVLPGTTGWVVLDSLRRLDATPPVVLVTVCGDAATLVQAVRRGVAACVFKPFPVQDLVTTCERVLKGRLARPVGSDRRREPRRPLDIALTASHGDLTTHGHLVDLSPQGAQVDLAAPLEPGDPVSLSFQVPAGDFPVHPEGRVQWRRASPGGFAHGLRFDLPADAERYLRDMLEPPAGLRGDH